ncbi:GFA family protein [Phyllobacterium sp. CCNWLW109]|uniref:GFA family protein n=1 Tax=Phyllobacterium sp. CCNWLW109 TaxID=3127479 RepID=UPI003FCC9D05
MYTAAASAGYRVVAIERTHCHMCRRTTGSALAVLSWVKADNLHWVSAQPKQRRSSPFRNERLVFSRGTPLVLICDKSDEATLYGRLWMNQNSQFPHIIARIQTGFSK